MLSDGIAVMVLAVIAGAQDAEDVADFGEANLAWLRQFFPLAAGAPAHDFYLRLTAVLKPDAFELIIRQWITALREPVELSMVGAHVAFDGQRLRGSMDRAAKSGGVHMLSAYVVDSGFVAASAAVSEKSNEIPAMQEMVQALDLRGATVTADAMHCQRETALAIADAGAQYVLQVKGNQPTLLKECEAHFAELARRRRPGQAPAVVDQHKDVDKGHGRIETRKVIVSRNISDIEGAKQWRDLGAVVAVLRQRTDAISSEESQEISYFVCSRGLTSAKAIGALVRNHWAIENELHHSLDVTWGSDAHQVRNRNAAENFARLRRFGAGLVTAVVGWGMSAKRVRKGCGWNPDGLLKVPSGQVIERERLRRVNRKGAKDEVPPSSRRSRNRQTTLT